jgi:hypothetical protein
MACPIRLEAENASFRLVSDNCKKLTPLLLSLTFHFQLEEIAPEDKSRCNGFLVDSSETFPRFQHP